MESLARLVVILVVATTIAGGIIGAGLGLIISRYLNLPRSGSLWVGLLLGMILGFLLLPIIGRLS